MVVKELHASKYVVCFLFCFFNSMTFASKCLPAYPTHSTLFINAMTGYSEHNKVIGTYRDYHTHPTLLSHPPHPTLTDCIFINAVTDYSEHSKVKGTYREQQSTSTKVLTESSDQLTLVFLCFFTLIFGDNLFITIFSKLCSR